MNPFEYKVSLRLEHPSIDPEQISEKLSMPPDISWKAGSRRISPKGKPLEGVYEKTYWSCALEHPAGLGLADFLANFTAGLATHKPFFKWIRTGGGRSEYFVGWFSNGNSGEMLSFDLLGKLSDLCIDLSLDVYASTDRVNTTPEVHNC